MFLRFSAMGDVALLTPVLQNLSQEYPNVRITLVTRPKFSGLFKKLNGIEIFCADLDRDFKGLAGIWRLSRKLQTLKPTMVIDVHDHLRTKLLRTFFRFSGTPIIVFDKGRKEKKNLIRQKNKVGFALTTTIDRYKQAIKKAGFNLSMEIMPPLKFISSFESLPQIIHPLRNKRWIGVAPFAAHFTKLWPLEKFEEVIHSFLNHSDVTFLLFGGGNSEKSKLSEFETRYSNCINLAGRFSLEEEISIINHLDIMVCVDSSNMHLASLAGVPVLSIWGGTHTMTGFGPFPNQFNRTIEVPVEHLNCRPCSVYGLSSCPRGDHACMTQISSEQVREELKGMLDKIPAKEKA